MPNQEPLTDAEIAEALEACAKATPGPWEAHFTTHGDPSVCIPGFWKTHQIAKVWTSPDDYGKADAEFIALARSLLPRAAVSAAALRQERDAALRSAAQLAAENTRLREQLRLANIDAVNEATENARLREHGERVRELEALVKRLGRVTVAIAAPNIPESSYWVVQDEYWTGLTGRSSSLGVGGTLEEALLDLLRQKP